MKIRKHYDKEICIFSYLKGHCSTQEFPYCMMNDQTIKQSKRCVCIRQYFLKDLNHYTLVKIILSRNSYRCYEFARKSKSTNTLVQYLSVQVVNKMY